MRLTLRQRQVLWAYAFLSIALVFFVIIRWYPALAVLQHCHARLEYLQGFRSLGGAWRITRPSGMTCGSRCYPRSDVRAAFTNTIGYVLYGVPAQMVLALAVALLLDRIRVLSTLFRVAYFAPYVTSAVAVAFVWNWLYLPQNGLLAQVFDLLRIPEQPSPRVQIRRWLRSPRWRSGRPSATR